VFDLACPVLLAWLAGMSGWLVVRWSHLWHVPQIVPPDDNITPWRQDKELTDHI